MIEITYTQLNDDVISSGGQMRVYEYNLIIFKKKCIFDKF